jgi:predicted AlkP superfamily phosphohydrolase/phosphomutase
VRADRLYPSAERRDLLPDLIVQWARRRRVLDRWISSPRYGTIAMPTPGKNTDGRGGNHRPHGFLLAAGPGVGHGQVAGASILDLAPTVYSLFGISPPAEMRGQVLLEVVGRGS